MPIIDSLLAELEQAAQTTARVPDEHLAWRPLGSGQELLAMPRVAVVSAVMLDHWYHHRGSAG